MNDKKRRTDILFNTGGAIAPKHPGGRPRTFDEPRVKVTLLLTASQKRALEDLKNSERARLAKVRGANWQAVNVNSIVIEAIEAYVKSKHK